MKLRLDYQHRRSFPWGGVILLIAASGSLLLSGSYYRELQGASTAWEAKLASIEHGNVTRQDGGSPTRSAANVAQEVQHANEVLRQLGLPWGGLFRAVESSADKDVVLLALEPDMGKREMKISGEAKNIPAMLGYVTRLGEQDMFESVYLLNHHVQLQDRDKPVRFALVAVLKAQP